MCVCVCVYRRGKSNNLPEKSSLHREGSVNNLSLKHFKGEKVIMFNVLTESKKKKKKIWPLVWHSNLQYFSIIFQFIYKIQKQNPGIIKVMGPVLCGRRLFN